MKYYNVYEVGTGKLIGWTQNDPLSIVYRGDPPNEEGIGSTSAEPGSSQILFDEFPGQRKGVKVNVFLDQHRK